MNSTINQSFDLISFLWAKKKPIIILGFITAVIASIVSFLVLKSHVQSSYNKWKLTIFLIGTFFVILSEVSIDLISENMINNTFNILSILITFLTMYCLYSIKSKKL